MTKAPQGRYYVIDVARDRVSPFGVEKLIRNTARIDGLDIEVVFGQAPASSGKIEATNFIRMLAGFAADRRMIPSCFWRLNGYIKTDEYGTAKKDYG